MRRHLAEARDEVPATVSVTTRLLHGRPARAIAALAESGRYDLVVTGPRPLGRLGRLLHHSVTHGLLSRTRVSVLAVKAAVERRAARRRARGRTAPHPAEPHQPCTTASSTAPWPPSSRRRPGSSSAETADGAEIPFEVVRGGRRDSPLYCYRPLTADFIEQRVGLLSRLPSFLPAVHALSGLGRLGDYLESRGERGYPAEPRARAEFALRVFLSRVFEESTDFALSPERLERAYARGRVGALRRAHRDRRHRAAAGRRDRLARARPRRRADARAGRRLPRGRARRRPLGARRAAPAPARRRALGGGRGRHDAGRPRPRAPAAPAHGAAPLRRRQRRLRAAGVDAHRRLAMAALRARRPRAAAARSRSPSPPTRRTSCAPSARSSSGARRAAASWPGRCAATRWRASARSPARR